MFILHHQFAFRQRPEKARRVTAQDLTCCACKTPSHAITWKKCPEFFTKCVHIAGARSAGGLCATKRVKSNIVLERFADPLLHVRSDFFELHASGKIPLFWSGQEVFAFFCGNCIDRVLFPRYSDQIDNREKKILQGILRYHELMEMRGFVAAESSRQDRARETSHGSMKEYLDHSIAYNDKSIAKMNSQILALENEIAEINSSDWM